MGSEQQKQHKYAQKEHTHTHTHTRSSTKQSHKPNYSKVCSRTRVLNNSFNYKTVPYLSIVAVIRKEPPHIQSHKSNTFYYVNPTNGYATRNARINVLEINDNNNKSKMCSFVCFSLFPILFGYLMQSINWIFESFVMDNTATERTKQPGKNRFGGFGYGTRVAHKL